MANFSEFFKQLEMKSEVEKLRNKFYESRSEYELGLRNFILNKVNDCSCCFESLFKKTETKVENRTFYSDLHPDELKVLEEMYFVTVNDLHKPIN